MPQNYTSSYRPPKWLLIYHGREILNAILFSQTLSPWTPDSLLWGTSAPIAFSHTLRFSSVEKNGRWPANRVHCCPSLINCFNLFCYWSLGSVFGQGQRWVCGSMEALLCAKVLCASRWITPEYGLWQKNRTGLEKNKLPISGLTMDSVRSSHRPIHFLSSLSFEFILSDSLNFPHKAVRTMR